MPTRWHMMSEKQLSILIQGRNYARGNRQIIRIPRAFACISAGAPWLWRSVMEIDKVSQEPARLRMLTAPFHGTFFFHWKFIVRGKCLHLMTSPRHPFGWWNMWPCSTNVELGTELLSSKSNCKAQYKTTELDITNLKLGATVRPNKHLCPWLSITYRPL